VSYDPVVSKTKMFFGLTIVLTWAAPQPFASLEAIRISKHEDTRAPPHALKSEEYGQPRRHSLFLPGRRDAHD